MKFFPEKYYKDNRNGTADLLKGLAVIFMIQVHVTELFLKPDLYNSVYGKISLFFGGPPAAPLFMAVMGYFLAASKKRFSSTIKRGILLLAGGFLLNAGLNANLLYKIYTGKLIVNPYEFIFGVDILFLAGLSVLTIALIKRLFKDNVYLIGGLTIVVVLVHPILPTTSNPVFKYLNAYFYGDYSWSYFPFFPWFGYVLAGYLFNLTSKKISFFGDNKANYLAFALVAGLGLTFTFALDISSSLEVYYHHELLFFTWTILFLLVISFLANKTEERAGNNAVIKFIKFLGQNVTLAYVFQWLIIGNIATEVYKTFSLQEGLISFFIVTLITYLLIYIFRWSEKNYFNTRGNSFSGK